MECDVHGMGSYLREARTEVGLAGKASFWPARKLGLAATEVLAVIARAAIAGVEQWVQKSKLEEGELRRGLCETRSAGAGLAALRACWGACGRGCQDFDAASANHRAGGRITPLTGSSGHHTPIPTFPFI